MPNDRTILRPPAPKYKIKETVYARASAIRGFLEPLTIANIQFDPSNGYYYYSFRRNPIDPMTQYENPEILPIRLHEHEIIIFCEALDIQISTLERDLNSAVKLYSKQCPNGVPLYIKQPPTTDKFGRTQPPPPRFGYNEVAYLIDSATSVGRLEAFRIHDFKFDLNRGEWIYYIQIQPRLERNMTIGDRDDMRHSISMQYHESELSTFCETQLEVVNFLTTALNRARTRKRLHCLSESGETTQ